MTPKKRVDAIWRRLRRISAAISQDVPVDWEEEHDRIPEAKRPLRRLRQLEAVARANRMIVASFRSVVNAESDPGLPDASRDAPGEEDGDQILDEGRR
ncbi:MAG: hypothetical protein KC729_05270 [Candidatus Eisenbacteria bacterium]|uniref:Uncharacterized protein n=1 Tax=Eiseniibacteriota bacterium TaxID=2212470 RepID=A0A956LX00_UNCEI|nr:hypothetical protein [Candidatus Eisenbacteria bacterium]